MPDSPQLAHLVVVSLEEHAGSALPTVQRLTKLIRAFGTKGGFSVSVDRQSGPKLHCAFEIKSEADRLADTMDAQPIEQYEGWASQRAFQLHDKANRRLAKLLRKTSNRPKASDKAKGAARKAVGDAKDAVKKALDD